MDTFFTDLIPHLEPILERGQPSKVHMASHSSAATRPGIVVRQQPQLTLCLSGSADYSIPGADREQLLTLQEGEALFQSPGCWKDLKGGDFVTLGFLFTPSRIEFFESDSSVGLHHKNVKSLALNKAWEPFEALHFYSEQMAKNKPGKFSDNILSNTAHIVLYKIYEILTHKDLEQWTRPQKSRNQFESVLAYLMEYFHLPITRDDVAKQFNLNGNYVNELFKKHLGCTFKEYLTTLRLENARNLLKENSLKVKEIAKMCGFGSPDNFIYSFRTTYNISPLQMRKAMLANGSASATQLQSMENISGYKPLEKFPPEWERSVELDYTNDSNNAVRVFFINTTNAPVELFWLGADRKRISFGTIDPGKRRSAASSPNHIWLLADANGEALHLYKVGNKPGVAVLKGNQKIEEIVSTIQSRVKEKSMDKQSAQSLPTVGEEEIISTPNTWEGTPPSSV